MARYTLLGISIDLLSEQEIFDEIMRLAEGDKPEHVILLDTYLLMKAQFDKSLAHIINSAALVIPISKGVVNGLKFITGQTGEAHNFFNLTIHLFSRLTDFKRNIYIIGGKNEKIIRRAETNVKGSFPGIRLMGTYHMGYKKPFEKNLITAIQKTSPSLVLVSTGRPKQEQWIARNKKGFKQGVFLGVEDFVQIIGGKDKNANRSKIPVVDKNLFRFIYFIDYGFALLFNKIFNRQPKPAVKKNDEDGVGSVIIEESHSAENVETASDDAPKFSFDARENG
ncbi:MAG: WecB/TagA/CpsF family glycosyltransferase [Spirochaetales bacterium]|nr:WecB/TagA/CpsF family glycosyltransferase [Spirochaetales bacterium]